MEKFIKWLFTRLQTKDSGIIEIYFELLNVWWLVALWLPGTSLALDITKPIYLYLAGVWTGCIVFIALYSLLNRSLSVRITVLLSYVAFYFLTGLSLLIQSPINIIGGFFICQGILAAFLAWKLKAKG